MITRSLAMMALLALITTGFAPLSAAYSSQGSSLATTTKINEVVLTLSCTYNCGYSGIDFYGYFGSNAWTCTNALALSESSCVPSIAGSYGVGNYYNGCQYPCYISFYRYTGSGPTKGIHFYIQDAYYIQIVFKRSHSPFTVGWNFVNNNYYGGGLTMTLQNTHNGAILSSSSCSGQYCTIAGGWKTT